MRLEHVSEMYFTLVKKSKFYPTTKIPNSSLLLLLCHKLADWQNFGVPLSLFAKIYFAEKIGCKFGPPTFAEKIRKVLFDPFPKIPKDQSKSATGPKRAKRRSDSNFVHK